MTANELLEKILVLLNFYDRVLFSFEEVSKWPAELFECFTVSGLLEAASPANSLICHGCEQNCIMPVEVLPALNNRPARAFIACDKCDDMGRIPVELKDLEQWQTTRQTFAVFLAKALEMPAALVVKKDSSHWDLGTFKGYKHQRPLILEISETIQFSIAGHTIPLIECFLIDQHQITINRDKLNRLVDFPRSTTETPEKRKARFIEREKQLRAKGVKKFLDVIAKEEGISKSRVKQILQKKTPSSKNTKLQ